MFTIAYLPFMAGFLMLTLSAGNGVQRVIVFILLTISNDIGGYASGVLFGKHPIAPQISPKGSVLVLDDDGLARRGVLIRHLVMPGLIDETEEILRWIAAELGPGTYVNLMAQYRPADRARTAPSPPASPTCPRSPASPGRTPCCIDRRRYREPERSEDR